GPQVVADAAHQERVPADHVRRELVVDEVGEDRRRGVEPAESDRRSPDDPLARLDLDPAGAVGVEHLQRVPHWPLAAPRFADRANPDDLHSLSPGSSLRTVASVSASSARLSVRIRVMRAKRSAAPDGSRVDRWTPLKSTSTTISGRTAT